MMNVWAKRMGSVAIAASLLVGGAAVTSVLGKSVPAYAESGDTVQTNTISVTGTGEIDVKPDMAYLSLGVQTNAATAKDAQTQNAAVIQKLTNLLKGTWKIDAADIQTSQFYVQPNYSYSDKDGQKITGYIAYHTLKVKYTNLDQIGALLDDASSAGANQIGDVTFTVQNPDQYQEQVIAKAMANANLKAGAIAKAANRQLGSVLNIVQNDGSLAPIFTHSVSFSAASSADSAKTSVEPGEITVNTSLSVQYLMK